MDEHNSTVRPNRETIAGAILYFSSLGSTALITAFAASNTACYCAQRYTITEEVGVLHRTLNVGGTTIAYEERGNGHPVVLIHGFGANSYTWRKVAAALADEYRLIAIDLKGFGKSDKPRDARYSLDDQALILDRFISQLDIPKVTLVGHSFGGAVALRTASLDIDAQHDRIDALVLIDTMALPQKLPSFVRHLRIPFLSSLALAILPPRFMSKAVLKDVFYRTDRIPDDLVDAYASCLCQADARYALITTARQIVPASPEKYLAQLPRITMPTLIIWGIHDTIIPVASSRKLVTIIPNAELELLEDCGHAPQEEMPDKTARLISDFLKHLTTIQGGTDHVLQPVTVP